MRAARTSLLLVAFALLATALHLTLALPADIAEAAATAASEAAAKDAEVSQRDPEGEHHETPEAPGYHFPRPSEIIHAVGSYVHGAHQQLAQDQHQEHHDQHEEHQNQHHNRPTTHRPPHRPLLGEREKIRVTKTVLVEFTKMVTRHPVCLKVNGVKPPCLPFQAYSASGAHNKPCNGLRDNEAVPAGAADDEDDLFSDAELKEGLYISPSAVAQLGESTQIIDAAEDLEAAARSARYLELRPPAPPAGPASATPALPAPSVSEQSGRQHLIASAANHAAAGAGNLLGHNRPEKIVEFKTLWVTKVEKVWDQRVTATLVADNCVPTDLKIPFCGGIGYGPTYEAGDEIVYKPPHKPAPVHKPIHKPVHKPVHHEPVHKPVHHEPVHKPVHHEPAHKPVHQEPVHKPVHHEPVHKPVHHEPVHKPVHHEPVHKPVHHEPVHKPVHHEPVHKPVHHEPVHKPVHEAVAYKPETEAPAYGIEYTDGPVDHHWREGEEAAVQEEAIEEAVEEVPVEENTAEQKATTD